MSDDKIRQAVDELRLELSATNQGLRQTQEALRQTQEAVQQTQEGLETANRRFGNFLLRFEEVAEMLITHDTEQLQRVTGG